MGLIFSCQNKFKQCARDIPLTTQEGIISRWYVVIILPVLRIRGVIKPEDDGAVGWGTEVELGFEGLMYLFLSWLCNIDPIITLFTSSANLDLCCALSCVFSRCGWSHVLGFGYSCLGVENWATDIRGNANDSV